MKESFDLKDRQFKKLMEVLASLDTSKKCRDFMLDLCTPAELKALVDRWEVARLIKKGINYREIAAKTGASTTTITRVGRSLKYGNGGYLQALAEHDPEQRTL